MRGSQFSALAPRISLDGYHLVKRVRAAVQDMTKSYKIRVTLSLPHVAARFQVEWAAAGLTTSGLQSNREQGEGTKETVAVASRLKIISVLPLCGNRQDNV